MCPANVIDLPQLATITQLAQAGHTLDVQLLSWGHVHFQAHCHEPPDAICHTYCQQGCESWNADHEHPLTRRAECSIVEWIQAEGAEDSYGGREDVTLYSGMPIKAWWEGGTMLWAKA